MSIEKDAERYQFLRWLGGRTWSTNPGNYKVTGDTYDECVDELMKQTPVWGNTFDGTCVITVRKDEPLADTEQCKFNVGDERLSSDGIVWKCMEPGTPGVWKRLE